MKKEEKKPDFEILTQYIKDFSFEAPSSPKIFFDKVEEKPNIEIGLEVKTTPSGENLFEVMLNIKVKNTLKDQTLFLIDLSYAAMIVAHETDNSARERILMKQVPAYLFPFVRGIIADVTKESGFNPFILAPINFDNIEAQRKNEPTQN